jgi:hypothetical protein
MDSIGLVEMDIDSTHSISFSGWNPYGMSSCDGDKSTLNSLLFKKLKTYL